MSDLVKMYIKFKSSWRRKRNMVTSVTHELSMEFRKCNYFLEFELQSGSVVEKEAESLRNRLNPQVIFILQKSREHL